MVPRLDAVCPYTKINAYQLLQFHLAGEMYFLNVQKYWGKMVTVTVYCTNSKLGDIQQRQAIADAAKTLFSGFYRASKFGVDTTKVF